VGRFAKVATPFLQAVSGVGRFAEKLAMPFFQAISLKNEK
jgi:hypothetical protein